jgi:hypothetical protein
LLFNYSINQCICWVLILCSEEEPHLQVQTQREIQCHQLWQVRKKFFKIQKRVWTSMPLRCICSPKK